MVIPPDDAVHISLGHRKADLSLESAAVRRGRTVVPLEHIAAPGIVISQRVRNGIIGSRVALQQLSQIPRSGEGVRLRIQAMLVVESGYLLGIGPFLGRLLA